MALKIEDPEDVTGDADALADLLTSPPPSDQDGPAEFTQDPDPDYGRTPIEDRLFVDKPTPSRVSVSVRKDIRGKIAMLLVIVGGGLAARDQHCGNALLDAIPDTEEDGGDTREGIATALSDLICDSPDMVKWFTTSGRYLKWLTLAMSVQPVIQAAVSHHISHTVREDQAAPDWSGYAAN